MDDLYTLPRGTRFERQAIVAAGAASLLLAALAGYGVSGAALLQEKTTPSCWAPSRSFVVWVLVAAGCGIVAAVRVRRLRAWLLPGALLGLAYVAWSIGGGAAGKVCRPGLYWQARSRMGAWPGARRRCDRWGLAAAAAVLGCEGAYIALLARGLRAQGDTHGSARFATEDDLKRQFTLEKPGRGTGTLVGRWRGRNVLWKDDGHILLVAPSGGGKTTCHVVPALLDRGRIEASALVLDVKGELYKLTSGFRAAHGHRIVRLNPAEEGEDLARYNPL